MASVFLGDLDDFIQPSQSCVNPMFTSSSKQSANDNASIDQRGVAKISLDSGIFSGLDDNTVRPDLIKTTSGSDTATVSLNDCLACSGCVTSAETVLITEQSKQEFLKVLQNNNHKKFIVSISPQSRASIAAHFNLNIFQTHKKLVTLFKSLGVHLVLDTTCSTDFTLIEARAEFIHRYRNQVKTPWKSPPISFAESSSKTVYPETNEVNGVLNEVNPYTCVPMLASACPGWVCYAEKSNPNAIPYISTTKSPQQIMGTIVKQIIGPRNGLTPNEVYHVTVMPCYDKKLEASRKDFFDGEHESREVDSVLATSEVLEIIESNEIDFCNLMESDLTQDEIFLSGLSQDQSSLLGVSSSENYGSGGYLEHILRYASKELFGITILGELVYEEGKNTDFREVSVVVNNEKVLRFAQAYGFRNIQSIITKIKRDKCPYHFVEIMACPSGCLNGGGQIKDHKSLEMKKRVEILEKKFRQIQNRPPEINPAVQTLYTDFQMEPFSKKSRSLFHTRYHAVPKLEQSNPMGIKW